MLQFAVGLLTVSHAKKGAPRRGARAPNRRSTDGQEKTLEFMLFDLAACIQKDNTAPAPPPVK